MLPALVHIEAQPRAGPNEPIVLVLAPTRELAMQTAEVTDKVGSPCGVHCACIYGGAPKGPQYAALRNGAQVVVATPGRLQDLFDEGAVSFKRVTYLTLDEADRMLDLGFEPAIRSLAGAVRADRQTLMFSATWPISIQGLASEFLCSPVMVRIGSDGTRASHSITQVVEVLESDARDGRLEQLLMQYQGGKQAQRRCIIFVLYKKEATRVAEWLRRRGWNAREIQGDMPQKQRTDTVAAFKQGTMPLLIATDVAARGLDIPGVETVINYSFPLTIEDYVHRIGRTGRAGATGVAHTFFCQQDKCAWPLSRILSFRPPTPPPPPASAHAHDE
jgi:ATP-dependent RNA helicase DBP3